MEAVDLANPTTTCNLTSNYPFPTSGLAVGIIDGLIKSCGGSTDTEECYDYNPTLNSWTSSPSLLNERYGPRSSFIDGIWLVSGDGSLDGDVSLTTEMWTGSGFEPGPLMPIEMSGHCQLTINSTHILFADARHSGRTFLFGWYTQTWTELPPMTVDREDMSCGLVHNPDNGMELGIV